MVIHVVIKSGIECCMCFFGLGIKLFDLTFEFVGIGQLVMKEVHHSLFFISLTIPILDTRLKSFLQSSEENEGKIGFGPRQFQFANTANILHITAIVHQTRSDLIHNHKLSKSQVYKVKRSERKRVFGRGLLKESY